MSAVPKKKRLTEEEYLVIERAAEFRSEFYNGELFAMAGASRQHGELHHNLIIELGNRLRGGECRTYGPDQRVNVKKTGLYAYPDLLIACHPEFEKKLGVDILLNPRVVFEILSKSTESYDRGTKFRHFQRLPSMQEYVLVSEDRMVIERYVRQKDGTWVLKTFDDPEGTFALATLKVRIPLSDIYRGVEVTEPPLP
jgi:Uma2 family endonuclease